MKKKFLNQLLVFIGFIFLIEIIYKALVYHTFFNSATIYTLLFSLPFTFLFMLIKIFNHKVNRILFYVIELGITIYFAFQYFGYFWTTTTYRGLRYHVCVGCDDLFDHSL